MSKKDEEIRARLPGIEKDGWIKYVKEKKKFENLSQLVRYCVQGYIDGDLIEKEFSSQTGIERKSEIDETIELLKEFKDFKKTQENQNEQLHMISTYITNSQRTFPSEPIETMKKHDIERDIIKVIGVKPMTSEQLATIFEISEHRILKFLNSMLQKRTLGLNDKMEYIIVESEDQLKELKFGEVK